MWFQKHKWKIMIPVLVVAVLAASFYIGGNSPASRGWEVGETGPVGDIAPDDEMPQPPVHEPETPPEEAAKPDTETEMGASNEEPAEPDGEMEPVTKPDPVPAQPPEETASETGQDSYLTDPVPEGNPMPVEPQDVTIGSTAYTCTISINCRTILDNMDYCDPAKVGIVPADGWLLQPISVTFYEGESVFNVLQRVCKQQKIHMEFVETPIYNSAYIEGIGNFYEFDVGQLSGWMYQVNGWFPNYGCSRYQLRDGDVIGWVYTCDLGGDVGGDYAAGNGRR